MKTEVYDNPMLSMNARFLYLYFLRIGRVATVEELTTALAESEYAIKNAMKELKKFDYIRAVKYQVNGQWRTLLKFSDESLNVTVKNMLEIQPPTDEIPTVGETAVLSVCNTNDKSISDNDRLEILRISNLGIHTEFQEENPGGEMGWPILGDDETPRRQKEDDEVGVIGKVDDHQKKLKAKYKPTRFEDTPQSKHRSNRPEEDWNTTDLVAEFYSLYRSKCGSVPAQVNGQQFSVWINRQVGEGTDRTVILKAIRKFFNDRRLLKDPGVGEPLWRRFIAFYYTAYGTVAKDTKQEVLSNQEKMLKLLEG